MQASICRTNGTWAHKGHQPTRNIIWHVQTMAMNLMKTSIYIICLINLCTVCMAGSTPLSTTSRSPAYNSPLPSGEAAAVTSSDWRPLTDKTVTSNVTGIVVNRTNESSTYSLHHPRNNTTASLTISPTDQEEDRVDSASTGQLKPHAQRFPGRYGAIRPLTRALFVFSVLHSASNAGGWIAYCFEIDLMIRVETKLLFRTPAELDGKFDWRYTLEGASLLVVLTRARKGHGPLHKRHSVIETTS